MFERGAVTCAHKGTPWRELAAVFCQVVRSQDPEMKAVEGKPWNLLELAASGPEQ